MESAMLEAITIKMERIENRKPHDYMQSAKWQALNKERNRISNEIMRKELAYHKDRLARLGEVDAKDSAIKIKQYEAYLEKKGEKNELK
jgi:hypothetical protein